eukprot:6188353-Pleurochrysis_carterae.AAC.5
MAAQSAAALERKREENIAKKEAERKQKIQEIKQRKAELKLQRVMRPAHLSRGVKLWLLCTAFLWMPCC